MKIFDLHCDTADKMFDKKCDFSSPLLQVNSDVCNYYDEYTQVFAMWIDSKKQKEPKKYTFDLINYFKRNMSEYSKNSGVKYILSIEGGEALEDQASNVDFFYANGVKIITLLWNYKNLIGTPSCEGDIGGISTFGRKVINRMNELNMIIDLSHINIQGFYECCEIADKPIVSHSNSYSVCSNKRNITDEQFEIIKSKKGLVGINFYPYFLNNTDKADVNDIIRHVYHFLSIGGEDVICLGSDFDGIDCFPIGFSNAKGYMVLAEEMLKINFSEKIIAKIMYLNGQKYFKINKI